MSALSLAHTSDTLVSLLLEISLLHINEAVELMALSQVPSYNICQMITLYSLRVLLAFRLVFASVS